MYNNVKLNHQFINSNQPAQPGIPRSLRVGHQCGDVQGTFLLPSLTGQLVKCAAPIGQSPRRLRALVAERVRHHPAVLV